MRNAQSFFMELSSNVMNDLMGATVIYVIKLCHQRQAQPGLANQTADDGENAAALTAPYDVDSFPEST